jgi:hypothetical protein
LTTATTRNREGVTRHRSLVTTPARLRTHLS